MTLDIDMTRPLRGADALVALVLAVVAADDHDEAESVEWKSTLDLGSKRGCFHVARAILGMANREPARSRTAFDGYGYVVVGCEPSSLCGIASVDPSDYTGTISDYVGGARGPAWTPVHLGIDGHRVAVFVVEPPEPGHPAWPLRRELSPHPKGRIFVRKHGKTEPADDADIDMLSARAAAASRASPGATVAVELLGHLPLPWFDQATVSNTISQWVEEREAELIRDATLTERGKRSPEPDQSCRPITAMEAKATGIDLTAMRAAMAAADAIKRQQEQMWRAMQTAASIFGTTATPDDRTLDQYVDEVKEWSSQLRKRAVAGFAGIYVSQGLGAVQVRVTNLSNRFMNKVEAKVTFPWHEAKAFDEQPDYEDLPAEPHRFGKPQPRRGPFDYFGTLPFIPSLDPSNFGGVGRRTWIEDGSINLTFDLGTLRPQQTDVSDTVWILLPAKPEGGALEGTWQMTAEGIHAVIDGTLSVPVAVEPVSPPALIRSALSDDEA